MIEIKYNNQSVYEPLEVESTAVVNGTIDLTLKNINEEDATDVGIWIQSADNMGDVDRPADFASFVDYNDLIRWGNYAVENTTTGGLIYEGNTDVYFSSNDGASVGNKIIVGDIEAGAELSITLRLEIPLNVSSRRLYVSLSAE